MCLCSCGLVLALSYEGGGRQHCCLLRSSAWDFCFLSLFILFSPRGALSMRDYN